MKIGKKNIFLLIAFFGISLLSNAQDDWTEVKVLEIISTNKFFVQESKTSEKYMVEIFKTKPIEKTDTLYNEGMTFLKDNVLGRIVFFVLENSDVETKQGTILYECEPNKGYPDNDLPPCLSASPLDYTLIKNGYVQNLGNKLFPGL